MSIPGMGVGTPISGVDIRTLPPASLMQLKTSLEQEIDMLQEPLTILKMEQTKFQESLEAIEKVKPEDDGRGMLVPLTGSIYVPGMTKEPEKLFIDIGSGCYVVKNLEDSKKYFRMKIAHITQEMEKAQKYGNEKLRSHEEVSKLLNLRLEQSQNRNNPPSSS